MTLREFLVGELIDIIEWNDDSDDTMAWRFSRPKAEIKNGAQLIVRPGQTAILVDQGKIADVFQSGRHELTTANMPLLSSFRGWKYGFESPFKADVLFLATKQFVGRKWGTSFVIEGFDVCPFKSSHRDRRFSVGRRVLWIFAQPRDERVAEVAQGKGARRISFEVCAHKFFETARADNGLEAGEVFFEGGEKTEPVLSVVDFEALEGRETVVGLDEGVGLCSD